MELFGVRLVGISAETGHKLLLTLTFLAGVLLLRAVVVAVVHAATGRHPNERLMFWTRQGASVGAATLSVMALLSIWFDDPTRLATGLGIFGAGLAFALQRVVTALAGYLVILRGKTFTVGDRITMGGVRGDVIALSFMQTKIMEMGQPPAVQGADPAMWVRARQFTGRIVTVTNDKVFDEPVYNYTREFPFIWEEMTVPVPYRADRARAEAILLECVAASTEALDVRSEPVRRALERRYIISLDDLTPRVFYRLTDNWLELTVRFIVRDHGVRDLKDAIARAVLREFERAGIRVASATYEITAAIPVRLEPTEP
ncbi:MAG TPA: mechanosensitive ion channel domain-containing protein [Vicinamibacterales bacterium]|nr:mechanosensitive ion channel domain-containing protein [Vicinamibacterales bacterium]